MSKPNVPARLILEPFKIGLGICHDIRFNELSRLYNQFGSYARDPHAAALATRATSFRMQCSRLSERIHSPHRRVVLGTFGSLSSR